MCGCVKFYILLRVSKIAINVSIGEAKKTSERESVSAVAAPVVPISQHCPPIPGVTRTSRALGDGARSPCTLNQQMNFRHKIIGDLAHWNFRL